MKKTITKVICALLSLTAVFTLMFSVINASAHSPKNSTWSNEWGEIKTDGEVNAADARLVLRSSARLEQLDERQTLNADVNKDGKITSADARQILRVAAKIDKFRVKAELNIGQEYVIDSVYDNGAYNWSCTVDSDNGLELTHTYGELPPHAPEGETPEQTYTFTAKVPGTYEVVFAFTHVGDGDMRNEIIYTFVVK